MARRRLTLKRIDPWSVLKFGFVANLAMLAIWLLGAGIVWFFVRQLELIEKVCEIAGDVGFVECGVNGGNLFRALVLLGLLGTVIQTGLFVFLAFLHNLIADLVGGISFTYTEEGAPAPATATSSAATTRAQAVAAQRPAPAATSGAPTRPPGAPAPSPSTPSAAPTSPGSSTGSSTGGAPTSPPRPAEPAPQRATSDGAPASAPAPRPGGPAQPGAPVSPPAPSSPPSNPSASPSGPAPSAPAPAPSSPSEPSAPRPTTPDWDLFGPRGGGAGGSGA